MKLETRWDQVGEYRMFARVCEQAGSEKPPVVLVHGLSMSSRYLAPTARRLARDYHVYAPDLPGYGKSPNPPKVMNIDALAGALAAWTEHLGLGPGYYVANSMGCQITAALAQWQPERVRKAVWIGPSMDPRIRHLPCLLLRAAMNMLFEPLSFWPVLIHDYLAAGPKETVEALGYSIESHLEDRAPALDCPVLVLRGSHDWLASPPWVAQIVRLLPRGQSGVIRDGAHVSNFDSPDKVAARAKQFFEEG